MRSAAGGALLRVASNPFFPYMLGRIEEGIDGKVIAKKHASPEPPPDTESANKDTYWTVKDALDLIFGPAPRQDELELAEP